MEEFVNPEVSFYITDFVITSSVSFINLLSIFTSMYSCAFKIQLRFSLESLFKRNIILIIAKETFKKMKLKNENYLLSCYIQCPVSFVSLAFSICTWKNTSTVPQKPMHIKLVILFCCVSMYENSFQVSGVSLFLQFFISVEKYSNFSLE